MVRETTKKKIRLDKYLYDKGFADSRAKAKSTIMSGFVFVDNQKIDKPGALIKKGSRVEVRDKSSKYVSRGGYKLEKALSYFKINVEGYVCLDIGASTGGFTDCLLQHGAKKVFSFDVGYGQLDWKLRNDSRVFLKERINCRYLKPEDVGELVDLITIDVSFISLEHIFTPAKNLLKENGQIIALIKPQFEVGKGEVGRGGIVKDEKKHSIVTENIIKSLTDLDFDVKGVIESPILGSHGNKEFLVWSVLKV